MQSVVCHSQWVELVAMCEAGEGLSCCLSQHKTLILQQLHNCRDSTWNTHKPNTFKLTGVCLCFGGCVDQCVCTQVSVAVFAGCVEAHGLAGSRFHTDVSHSEKLYQNLLHIQLMEQFVILSYTHNETKNKNTHTAKVSFISTPLQFPNL